MRPFKRKIKPYPPAADAKKVGTYDLYVYSGGGYFYDEVLEYRVWVKQPGKDAVCHSFTSYEDALRFSKDTDGAEWPLVLVLQNEHVNEPQPGVYQHIKKPRIVEWQPDWLEGSKRAPELIERFLEEHNFLNRYSQGPQAMAEMRS